MSNEPMDISDSAVDAMAQVVAALAEALDMPTDSEDFQKELEEAMEKEAARTRWLDEGVDRGWVLTTACMTHEGVPVTPEEREALDAGEQPCIFIARLCSD